jgi:glutaredoxin/glutathione-dependent peroxiredoxin
MMRVGDQVPHLELPQMGVVGAAVLCTQQVLGAGRVLLLGGVAAFGPGSSDVHIPEYLSHLDELRAKGIDQIVYTTVNDEFVMRAWGQALGLGDGIRLLPDGNAAFATAMGVSTDRTPIGLGIRSRRYAALIDAGRINVLRVEEAPGLGVSTYSEMISHL